MVGHKTPLLSSVPFGACLTYSPRGQSEESRRSRDVTYDIKNVRPQTVKRAVEVLAQLVEGGTLADFFGSDVALIPAPRSAPLQSGWLWPAERICRELVAAGLAKEVLPTLKRVRKVPKSASAARGERPTAETHRDSIEMEEPSLLRPAVVTVVDDVVTRGATLLACASHVAAGLPGTTVRVFGLVRTQGFVEDIERIIEPCEGTITYDGTSVYRNP